MEICRNGRVHLIDFYGRDCVCGVFSDSENIADSKDSQRPFAVHLFNVAAFDHRVLSNQHYDLGTPFIQYQGFPSFPTPALDDSIIAAGEFCCRAVDPGFGVRLCPGIGLTTKQETGSPSFF